MLYVTTRGSRDAFTPHRTLCTNVAPDNGAFLPMRFPHFSDNEIRSFVSTSFEETVAYVLNAFFSAGLTKWDVGLCGGRKTARVQELNPKILLAELWHNPGNSFAYVAKGLHDRIYGEKCDNELSEWFDVAVKIAIWFGVYCDLCRNCVIPYGEQIDISVPADDFSYPIAAMYANLAGLPIGNIICNCTNTNEVWNLIHRGKMNVAALPEKLRPGIERFLLLRLDQSAVERFCNMKMLTMAPEEASELQKGLFCVVSGTDRIMYAINSTFRTGGCLVTPSTALCIAGLGDYRAQMRESTRTLILQEDSPILFADQIESATGIPGRKLLENLRE